MEHFRTIYTAFCLEHYPDKTIADFERDIAVLGKQLQTTPYFTGNTLVDAQLIGQASTQNNPQGEEKAKQDAAPDDSQAGDKAEAESPAARVGFDPLAFGSSRQGNGHNFAGKRGSSSWRRTNGSMMRGDVAHSKARKAAKESTRPAMPPPTPASVMPQVKPGAYNKELTTNQHSFMHYLCQEADRGNADIRPTRIQELMGLGDGITTSIYKPLEAAGYLQADKHSPRHVQLQPLRRPDGRTYEPLKKHNGVTICEPAYAQDYAGFDAAH